MKKLQIIAWILFNLGLGFKLLHYPGTSILLILGTLLLLIQSLIYLLKNIKTNLPSSFLHLSYSLITTYILFRIQFWPCGPMLFGFSLLFLITLAVTLVCFILHLKNKIQLSFSQIFLVAYFIFFFFLSFVHSDRVYYFFNINPVLNKEEIVNTNYYAWDKYSWFLYIANKQEEAIEANQKAQKAVTECLKFSPDEDTIQYLTLIKQHEQQIKDKNWTNNE